MYRITVFTLFVIGLTSLISSCGDSGSDKKNPSQPEERTHIITGTDTERFSGDYLPLAVGNKWVYNVRNKTFSDGSDRPKECERFIHTLEIVNGEGNNWQAELTITDMGGTVTNTDTIYLDNAPDAGVILKDSLILLPAEKNQTLGGASADALFYPFCTDIVTSGKVEYNFHQNIATADFSGSYQFSETKSWRDTNDQFYKGIGLFRFSLSSGAAVCSGGRCTMSTFELKGKLKSCVIDGEYYEIDDTAEIMSYATAASSGELIENVQALIDTIYSYCKMTYASVDKGDLATLLNSDFLSLLSKEDRNRLQKLSSEFDTFDLDGNSELSRDEVSAALAIPAVINVAEAFGLAGSTSDLIANIEMALYGDKYNSEKDGALIMAELNKVLDTPALLALFELTDQERLRLVADSFARFAAVEGSAVELDRNEMVDILNIPAGIYVSTPFETAESAAELVDNIELALLGDAYKNQRLIPTELRRLTATSLLQLFPDTDQARIHSLLQNFDQYDVSSTNSELSIFEIAEALGIPVERYVTTRFETINTAGDFVENAEMALYGGYRNGRLDEGELQRLQIQGVFELFSAEDQARLIALSDNFRQYDLGNDGQLSELEVCDALSLPLGIYIDEMFAAPESAEVFIENVELALYGLDSYTDDGYLSEIEIERVQHPALLQFFNEQDQARLTTLANDFDDFDTYSSTSRLDEVEIGDAFGIPAAIFVTTPFETAGTAAILIENAEMALYGNGYNVNDRLSQIELERITDTSLLDLFTDTDRARLNRLADNFETYDSENYPVDELTNIEVGSALSISAD